MTIPEIQFRAVGKRFASASAPVLEGIDLSVERGEFVSIIGPSGCGKSTLLRLIAGLEEITSGELIIDGQRVNETPPAKRGLALVFQSYALYPHMTVAENMAFSLKLAGESKQQRERKVKEAAEILHLTELLARKPKELSGGQRQRVAIGRAIVRKPKLFLFDEPLSNLDAALRVRMRLELTKLQKQLEATMIYVTHDQVEAMTMADKIVVMRAGLIEQTGSPLELYHHPENLFVAGFIGSPKMNFIPAVVTGCEASSVNVSLLGDVSLRLPADTEFAVPGDKVTVGVRPERLSLDALSPLRARVRIVERLGGESFVYLSREGLGLDDGQELTMKAPGDIAVEEDAEVGIRIDQAHCHLFDADGRNMAYRAQAGLVGSESMIASTS